MHRCQRHATSWKSSLQNRTTNPDFSTFLENSVILSIIYELVLVEVPLWYRRHQRTCPIRNPRQGWETPLFESTIEHFERQKEARWIWGVDRDKSSDPNPVDFERCKNLCHRRKGLGLLRACKQTYEEGSEVFWERNLFCFDSGVMFNKAVEGMSKKGRESVRRLSIVEKCFEGDFYQTLLHIITFLKPQCSPWSNLMLLENLVELEMLLDIFWWPAANYHLQRPANLKNLRAILFRIASHWDVDGNKSQLHIRVVKDLRLPKCSHETERGSGHYCDECDSELDDEIEAVKSFWTRSDTWNGPHIATDCVSAYQTIVRRQGVPAFDGNELKFMNIQIPDGSTHEVGLFGLPILDSKPRRQATIRFKRSQCAKGRDTRRPAVIEDDEDNEENRLQPEYVGKQTIDRGKRFKKASQPSLPTREEIEHERREKIRAAEVEERGKVVKQTKRAKKKMLKGMKALNLEKEGARKRVSRR